MNETLEICCQCGRSVAVGTGLSATRIALSHANRRRFPFDSVWMCGECLKGHICSRCHKDTSEAFVVVVSWDRMSDWILCGDCLSALDEAGAISTERSDCGADSTRIAGAFLGKFGPDEQLLPLYDLEGLVRWHVFAFLFPGAASLQAVSK